MERNRLIVGVSGASGAELARELLATLRTLGVETHLVVTRGAELAMRHELKVGADELRALASRCYALDDLGAAIASGTFRARGMVVAPCSMKTLAGIVTGYSDNLLLRAADVCLKEQRRLVLMPRETPLSRIHLRNLLAAAEAGCVLLPPMLTFYTPSTSTDQQLRQIVGKALDLFGFDAPGYRRWRDAGEGETP